MINIVDFKIAVKWSIKKETFIKIINTSISMEKVGNTVPFYEYYFSIEENGGDIGIYFYDSHDMQSAKIKKLTLSIPSAGYIGDLSTPANVPKDDHFYGYSETVVIKRADILNLEKKFFVDDILTLEFRGTIEQRIKPDTTRLSNRLWDAEDKDFTIIIEEQKIKAHKLVLRQYSTVLTEMFNSDVNQMNIDDFDYSAVNHAIRLCYDISTFRTTATELLNVLRFSDTYNMPVIKERTEDRLNDYITASNVCELANKSLELNAPSLKMYCINFISKCIKEGKQYDDALNLNIQIIKEMYELSVFRTIVS